MEPTGLSKYTVSFGLALAIASVVNGLLVIAKEKSAAVQAALQRLTGYQWVTHVVIVLAVFALGGWLFGRANGGSGIRVTASGLIGALVAGVATGALLIMGFYLLNN
jgi:hypothetical protein